MGAIVHYCQIILQFDNNKWHKVMFEKLNFMLLLWTLIHVAFIHCFSAIAQSWNVDHDLGMDPGASEVQSNPTTKDNEAWEHTDFASECQKCHSQDLNFENFLEEDACRPCTGDHLRSSISQTHFSKILYPPQWSDLNCWRTLAWILSWGVILLSLYRAVSVLTQFTDRHC